MAMLQSIQTLCCFTFHSPNSLSLNPKPPQPHPLPSPFKIPPLHLQLHCLPFLSEAETRRDSGSEGQVSSTDYLITSLDLPPESTHQFTKHRLLSSTENADAVLALFKDYGFTNLQMASIFARYPNFLGFKPNNSLKPKLDFFAQNGLTGKILTDLVTLDPYVLTRSLDNVIVPAFGLLKPFFATNEDFVSFVCSRGGIYILRFFSENLQPDVETLRRYGVPDSIILKSFTATSFGSIAMWVEPEKFKETVREVKELGFDPSSMMFIYGIRALSQVKRGKWEMKMEVFKSFGWSDEQIWGLFVKHPMFVTLSEESLSDGLDLLMNRLEWTVEDISKYPSLLSTRIDKKVIARLSLIKFLMDKGLVKKKFSGYAVRLTEDVFLKRYVEKHEDKIPGLLEVYREIMKDGS